MRSNFRTAKYVLTFLSKAGQLRFLRLPAELKTATESEVQRRLAYVS